MGTDEAADRHKLPYPARPSGYAAGLGNQFHHYKQKTIGCTAVSASAEMTYQARLANHASSDFEFVKLYHPGRVLLFLICC